MTFSARSNHLLQLLDKAKAKAKANAGQLPRSPRNGMRKPIALYRWLFLSLLLLSTPAWTQATLGELFASDPGAPSAVQPAGSGMAVTAGSLLSAGVAPATLKLLHGGQVRICPRSKISVNGDGRGLTLGMDAGSVEIDLRVEQSSADMIATPDLSIRLAGPGSYHFALGVTSRGDTCFKPLAGNKAGIVLSELLGTEEYGIAADQNAFFPGGKLAARSALNSDCGCPAPAPVFRAQGDAPTVQESPAARTTTGLVGQNQPQASPSPEAVPQSHLTVEAPFVFSANAPPAPAKVQFSTLPNVFLAQEELDPAVLSTGGTQPAVQQTSTPSPAANDDLAKKDKKGFLSKLKGFFTGLFHR